MWDVFIFGCGAFCGAVVVADFLGLKLAKLGDPFWIGWIEFRTWGLWKSGTNLEEKIVDDQKDDLKARVDQFTLLQLPGQPKMIHMGTSELVIDLWHEVLRLRRAFSDPTLDGPRPIRAARRAMSIEGGSMRLEIRDGAINDLQRRSIIKAHQPCQARAHDRHRAAHQRQGRDG
jgi:hypothetical protein